jgi:hypothetical protein
MPRFDSLTTSLGAPVTPADVAADLNSYAQQASAVMAAPLVVGLGATVPIVCNAEVTDPEGNYDAATGSYTVPSDGDYAVELDTVGPAATAFEIDVTVDGVPTGLYSQSVDQINGLASRNETRALLPLTAGQVIGFQTTDTVGGGFTLSSARVVVAKVGG